MTYWHDHEFRHELRGIADHYPKTYQKVGKILKEKGLLGNDVFEEWTAILQYMPKHVIPYRGMGDNKTWGEYNWTRRPQELAAK